MSLVDEDPRRAAVAADPITSALLDAMSDATAVLDPDGVIVAVNRAWRMFARPTAAVPTARRASA